MAVARLMLALALISLPVHAQNSWTGWLGPNRDGWVGDFKAPETWPKTLKKVWQVKVGIGYSSPLVSNGRIYTHTRQEDNEIVQCLDLKTHQVKWRKTKATPFKVGGGGEYHGKGPKSCPVLSEGRLFTMSITGILTAWDAKTGKQLWECDYGSRYKSRHKRWGASTSPIVAGRLVIAHFGTDFQGALVALHVETGKVAWEQGKDGPSYSSPLVVEINDVKQVVDWNERAIAGVDLKSGKKLWEYLAKGDFRDQNMPTPVFHKGLILLGAENRGIKGLAPHLEKGKWVVHRWWHQKKVALNMSTAVINDGLLYGFSHYDRGRFFCLEPRRGKVLWTGPPRTGQNVTFLSIPGAVMASIDTGELRVFKASRTKYQELASYKVAVGATWAPPVLLKEGILIKDKVNLTLWSLTQ